MCNYCKQFLSDFLLAGIRKELSFSKYLRIQSLHRILDEITDWMYRMYLRIPKDQLDMAVSTSYRIARRDRPLYEYELILYTATFNFLKFRLDWMEEETEYIKTILLEAGFLKKGCDCTNVVTYIRYTVSRVIITLHELHEDHEDPKGLMTDLNKLFHKEDDSADEFF